MTEADEDALQEFRKAFARMVALAAQRLVDQCESAGVDASDTVSALISEGLLLAAHQCELHLPDSEFTDMATSIYRDVRARRLTESASGSLQ